MLVVLKIIDVVERQIHDWRTRGWTVRYLESKRAAFIEISPVKPDHSDKTQFPIPTDLQGYARTATLLIKSEESGGNTGQSGSAIITCGLSGKPVRAYWVARDRRPCGIHAYLTIVEGAATLHATTSEGISAVTIYRHKITHTDDTAILTSEKQFQWAENEVPLYHTYSNAARAAFDKVHHFNCIEPHYINRT